MKSRDVNLIWESYKQVLKESMTATIGDRRPEHDDLPLSLLDIEYDILNKCFGYDSWSEFEREYFQQNRPMETFAPDTSSSDAFSPTGTINFYTSGLSVKIIREMLSKIQEKLQERGFEFNIGELEKREGRGDVIRIHILTNPYELADQDVIPEVQLSNSNMDAVLRSLGLDDIAEDYGGYVDVGELILRIKNISSKSVDANVRPKYHSDMEKFRNPGEEYKGPTMIDDGLDTAGIDERVKRLYDLAMWAKKNGYHRISIG
jgi:hypothetical protein